MPRLKIFITSASFEEPGNYFLKLESNQSAAQRTGVSATSSSPNFLPRSFVFDLDPEMVFSSSQLSISVYAVTDTGNISANLIGTLTTKLDIIKTGRTKFPTKIILRKKYPFTITINVSVEDVDELWNAMNTSYLECIITGISVPNRHNGDNIVVLVELFNSDSKFSGKKSQPYALLK